jgi:hypothetical protein
MVAEGGEKHIALEPLERDPDALGGSAAFIVPFRLSSSLVFQRLFIKPMINSQFGTIVEQAR